MDHLDISNKWTPLWGPPRCISSSSSKGDGKCYTEILELKVTVMW